MTERQKKKMYNSNLLLWTLAILIQMTVIRCLDVRAETGDGPAAQITIHSDIYTTEDQAETPADQYADENGNIYQLDHWELAPVFVKEQSRPVEKVIHYPGVEGAARIPETIEVSVQSGGMTTAVICEADSRNVIQEHWEDDFVFPITFHMYHSGYYQLADQMIPYNEERPELGGCETLLLDMIGLTAAEYRITDVQWTGDEYQNDAGETCRDAFAYGDKLVRDIEVVYKGQAVIPAYHGWQMKAVYQYPQEEQPAPVEADPASLPVVIETMTEPEPEDIPSPALWQKIMNTLLITVAVGTLLFFGGLLLLLLLHLVKTVRACYNKLHYKN